MGKTDLIPYRVALAAFRSLPFEKTLSPYNPSAYGKSTQYAAPGACPVCGFERFGFIRMNFPAGHPFFGHAICCPRCWPPPFGHNTKVALSMAAKEIARYWEE